MPISLLIMGSLISLGSVLTVLGPITSPTRVFGYRSDIAILLGRSVKNFISSIGSGISRLHANPFNPNGTLEQATGASSYDPGAPSTVTYTPVAVTTADFASAQTVTPTGAETVGGYSYVAVDPAAPALASATSAAQDAPAIT